MNYVYFIQQKGDGMDLIKIGHTSDVELRVRVLQSGSVSKLNLVLKLRAGSEKNAKAVERALHGNYFRRRIGRTEWFLSNDAMVSDIEWLKKEQDHSHCWHIPNRTQQLADHLGIGVREFMKTYRRPELDIIEAEIALA